MVSGHTPVTIKSFCRSKDVVNLFKMNFSFFQKDFKDLRFCFENKLGSDSFPFGLFFWCYFEVVPLHDAPRPKTNQVGPHASETTSHGFLPQPMRW